MQISIQHPEMFAFSDYWKGGIAVFERVDLPANTPARNAWNHMKCSTTALNTKTKTKLRGLSPHANYTDRAAAAGRRR